MTLLAALAIGVLLCWTPSKAVGYIAPYGMAAVMLLVGRSGEAMLRAAGWVVFWVLLITLYSVIYRDFEVRTAWLAAITYGAVLIPLCAPSLRKLSPAGIQRIVSVLFVLLFTEASIGITQGIRIALVTRSFDMDNGDFVRGTMGFDLTKRGLENPMYAINMIAMVFFLVPFAGTARRRAALGLGVVAILLASVMHLTYFAVISVWVGLLVTLRKGRALRAFVSISASVVGIVALLAVLLPRNIATTTQNSKNILEARNAKVKLAIRIARDIPIRYPLTPLIGLGPAQLCSRAALIGTGLYFGGPMNATEVPFLPSVSSKPFSEFYLDLWISSIREKYHGSTQHAYSSFLSVISEFGIPAFLVVIGFVIFRLARIRSAARHVKSTSESMTVAMTAALVCFLFLIGFQENYWEVPQAVSIPMLLTWMNVGRIGHWFNGETKARWFSAKPVGA